MPKMREERVPLQPLCLVETCHEMSKRSVGAPCVVLPSYRLLWAKATRENDYFCALGEPRYKEVIERPCTAAILTKVQHPLAREKLRTIRSVPGYETLLESVLIRNHLWCRLKLFLQWCELAHRKSK